MNILVLSTVFPNRKQPNLGLFVKERMSRVAGHCNLKVVAPVPWFPLAHLLKPGYRPSVSYYEIQEGIDVYHPKFFSVPGIFKFLDGFFLFLSLIIPLLGIRKKFDFDLIDAHFAYPEGLGSVLLGRFFKRPVTITLRGTIVPLSRIYLRRVQIVHALRCAARIFSVSSSLKEKAVSLGIPSEKIRVISNGVDYQKFYPESQNVVREQLGIPLDSKIMISVGGLVRRKGFHRVLKVLPGIMDKLGALTYVIVGGLSVEGDFGPELHQLVDELNLDQHVVFTGILTHDQVRKWLNAADLFCLATSNEGWANVFFEAMACGKPVVATRVGGNHEVVKNHDYGFLVDLGDSQQLESAIVKAFEKQWDHEKIIKYASQNDWEKVAIKVFQQFSEIIANYSTNF